MDSQDLKINTLEVMMNKNNEDHIAISRAMESGFSKISQEISDFKDEITNGYVRNESFFPVKIIAYGFVGIVMSGFISFLLALVWK